ncbi:hypothetical protein [Marinobacter changyiensis]|uniref:hypothetical protein n=1 Tax=Marinobacter changyiensis TaxID=2604091 RepID=UPI0012649109|nr:hypothetical protein [Marinobacter changyiensis]
MKKFHSLAFYALLTPAIALGSAALLAEEGSNGHQDLGEQDMDAHAEPENQNSELHEESTKSKYNSEDATGTTDSETGDQSGMQKEDHMESSSDNGMDE